MKLSNKHYRDELAKRIRHHRPPHGRPEYQLHYDFFLQTARDCWKGIKSYNGMYGIGKCNKEVN